MTILRCAVCGSLVTDRYRRKYCSDACQTSQKGGEEFGWLGKRWRVRDTSWRHFAVRECQYCGNDLSERGEHSNATVCADCRVVRRRRYQLQKDNRRYQVKHEPYTLEEIAARDGYRCKICVARGRSRHAKVNMKLLVPHLRAPTIDHVVAISQGGDDVRANVQLAHFGCNAWKRDGRRLIEQIALFG